MNQKRTTILALGCGSICALCVAAFTLSIQGEANAARAEALARYGGEQIEVVVATRDIAAGERVESSAIETRLWIADLLPEEAVSSAGDAIGKTATTSIFKGEVVSAKRFERDRAAISVPAGTVAVSVPAKAVQAVGGAISVGMSVDIYSSGDATTAAIAHEVPVIDVSVGESGALRTSGSGWITLAVSPESVQEIISAAAKTDLYFTLPGEGVDTAVIEESDLEETLEFDDFKDSASQNGTAKSLENDEDRDAAQSAPATYPNEQTNEQQVTARKGETQ